MNVSRKWWNRRATEAAANAFWSALCGAAAIAIPVVLISLRLRPEDTHVALADYIGENTTIMTVVLMAGTCVVVDFLARMTGEWKVLTFFRDKAIQASLGACMLTGVMFVLREERGGIRVWAWVFLLGLLQLLLYRPIRVSTHSNRKFSRLFLATLAAMGIAVAVSHLAGCMLQHPHRTFWALIALSGTVLCAAIRSFRRVGAALRYGMVLCSMLCVYFGIRDFAQPSLVESRDMIADAEARKRAIDVTISELKKRAAVRSNNEDSAGTRAFLR